MSVEGRVAESADCDEVRRGCGEARPVEGERCWKGHPHRPTKGTAQINGCERVHTGGHERLVRCRLRVCTTPADDVRKGRADHRRQGLVSPLRPAGPPWRLPPRCNRHVGRVLARRIVLHSGSERQARVAGGQDGGGDRR
eukprot:1195851-Prorocentrum_minimum.AAC.23